MDRIHISALRVFAYHGVLPKERENGQEFLLDITLHLDLGQAGVSDNLADTVNYDEVCRAAHDSMTSRARSLIEAAAKDVADVILDRFPSVAAVDVRLHKPHAPLTHKAGCVSVDISRGRDNI